MTMSSSKTDHHNHQHNHHHHTGHVIRSFTPQKPFKVLVLGFPAVGKTALTVRFITKRFIGDYDPTLEKKYTFHTNIDGDAVSFEVLDTAGQYQGCESIQLEEHIRWADAYVLVYCVTDRCSFEECMRLKFLIAHAKRTRKSSCNAMMVAPTNGRAEPELPVVLVANKNDLDPERMVSQMEGKQRSQDLGCTAYHDISVRESYDEALSVFVGLYRVCRSATSSRKNFRHNRQEMSMADDATGPPSPRRRDRRAVIGYSVSFDNGLHGSRPTSPKDSDSSSKDGSIKRKESVSKRIIRKVIS